MEPILVTGATGTLGREVVSRLVEQGREVRAISRRDQPPTASVEWIRADLAEPGSLGPAVAGVSAVVHCATNPAPRRDGDVETTLNLIEAVRDVGVGHLVYISIVGVDRVPFAYYRTKHRVEQLIEESGLGFTILRATQFHDLVLMVLRGLSRLPLVPVPMGVNDQPVDVTEVADRLVRLTLDGPSGRAPDMGGPSIHSFGELLAQYQRASGTRRRALPFRLPGPTYRAFAEGGHLAPEHRDGTITFDEFLAGRFP